MVKTLLILIFVGMNAQAAATSGQCQSVAQAFVDAIHKLHAPKASAPELKFVTATSSKAEHYQSPTHSYKVIMLIKADGRCAFRDLSYNPAL